MTTHGGKPDRKTLLEPFPELSTRATVLHVRTHAFSDRSAPFIRQTVLGLRPYLHNVVLTPSTDCANPSDVPIELVQVRDFSNPLACLAMGMQLRKKYPFVSLVMGHMGNGTRCARRLAAVMGVPMLGVFGGSDINVEMPKDLYRNTYAELLRDPSSHFLTVAGYLKDKLLEHGAPPERTYTWHRGVNLAEFVVVPRSAAPDQPVKLIVSARFYEVKGHEYVIRAVAKLKAQGKRLELVLLGDGPLKEQMQALVADLGVTDEVRFIGQVAHDQVKRHLHASDIYVHPSVACSEGRIEGIPNAIMEAHATGLPVVATDHGGICEVVLDGETGFLVEERNVDDLARRIGELVDSRELRLTMGRRGRAHIEQEFNLDLQARRLAARIQHTIKAAELFELRGWPLHNPSEQVAGKTKQVRSRGEVVVEETTLVDRFLGARFKSKQKVVGGIYSAYRNAVWTAVFRPYVHFLGNEISGYLGQELSSKLASVIGGLNTNGAAAPQLQAREKDEDAELLMSSALCPDCPHCPANVPWPDKACPLDAACMRALQQEFAPLPVRMPGRTPAVARAGELSLTDADLPADGKLRYPDGKFDRVHYLGDLQKVADVRVLLRELRRILKPEGELRLEIWPMPRGRDGARLMGNVAVPFAPMLFAPQVVAEVAGPVLRAPRQFDPAELRAWANEVGLLVHEESTLPPHEDPCEMHVQARFAPVFRKAGASRAKLARTFVARLETVGVAAAEDDATIPERTGHR